MARSTQIPALRPFFVLQRRQAGARSVSYTHLDVYKRQVTTGLIPNTGITLPFVSYGLTSLVSFCIGIGLVLNVGLQTRKY